MVNVKPKVCASLTKSHPVDLGPFVIGICTNSVTYDIHIKGQYHISHTYCITPFVWFSVFKSMTESFLELAKKSLLSISSNCLRKRFQTLRHDDLISVLLICS